MRFTRNSETGYYRKFSYPADFIKFKAKQVLTARFRRNFCQTFHSSLAVAFHGDELKFAQFKFNFEIRKYYKTGKHGLE